MDRHGKVFRTRYDPNEIHDLGNYGEIYLYPNLPKRIIHMMR